MEQGRDLIPNSGAEEEKQKWTAVVQSQKAVEEWSCPGDCRDATYSCDPLVIETCWVVASLLVAGENPPEAEPPRASCETSAITR